MTKRQIQELKNNPDKEVIIKISYQDILDIRNQIAFNSLILAVVSITNLFVGLSMYIN